MKSDKELAVELACAYIHQLYAMKEDSVPTLAEIRKFLNACYQTVSELPDEPQSERGI